MSLKYYVDVDDRTLELEVEEEPDGRYIVRGAGGQHVVDYLETTPHEASIVIDGRSTTFWFSGTNGSIDVSDGRNTFKVRALDERSRLEASIFGMKGSRSGGEVRSIMPGIVTRVLVSEGEQVEAGAPLLCVEAMKMENEVRAEGSGLVRKIHVKPGKTVSAGDLLVEMGS